MPRGLLYAPVMEWIVSLTDAVEGSPPSALEAPPEGATVVELRADLLPDLDPAEAVARCPLPILFTLRSEVEGGRGPADPVLRERAFSRARDAGVALIDLEAERDLPVLARLGLDAQQVILSWHDPSGTPADLENRVSRLLAHPSGLVKVVVTPGNLADLGRVLALSLRFNRSRRRRRLVAFGMGPLGLPSRYLAPLLGPRVAYAAWSAGAPAAPGQVPVARLRAAMGHLAGPPRRLFAVVGASVEGSLSPVMHAGGYAAAGMHALMVPVSVPEPEDPAELFRPAGEDLFSRTIGLGLQGLAVTAPWKGAAVEAATLASPRARRAHAANTLIPGPGRLLAENTDADGVRGALQSAGVDPTGLPALVQGTGGAGRGAAVALDLAGCSPVLLRGRHGERSTLTARRLGVGALGPADPAPAGAILVNATPLGGRDEDPLPFSLPELREAHTVLDMVYRLDGPTPLERACAGAGVRFIGGLSILLHQGIAQFAAMTGTVPPREALRNALQAFAPGGFKG